MTVAADIVAVFNDSLPNAVGIDPDTPAVNGDYVLNPGSRIAGAKRPAAVLVPLVERSAGLTVLLTQRTQHLHAHAGQVAFPGGRVDEGDIDAVDTALRETREEIGVDRAHIRIIGRLDTYETTTGFHVVPIVGLVMPPVEIIPDPFEVAEVFEVPLGFFMDPRNRKRHSLERGGWCATGMPSPSAAITSGGDRRHAGQPDPGSGCGAGSSGPRPAGCPRRRRHLRSQPDRRCR
ncbi:NUDIX hydrolase [Tistrella bauzanensis]